ncbi:MAG TPA: GAF domain-containing protein [Pseudonocardiaceae bacterium]
MSASAWSTQQLAEFLAALSAAGTEAAAALATVERTAEELDAEIAAIVCGDQLLSAVGYPDSAVPVAQLAAVAPGVEGQLAVPRLGVCSATAVQLEHPPGARLVVARCGTGLDAQEASLLRGIAHASSITMRMLHLFDEERAARQDSAQRQRQLEQLASEQAALRRVATLVAGGASPSQTWSAVAAEVGQLLGADVTMVLRYELDGTGTVIGGWGGPGVTVPQGRGLTIEGVGVAVLVLRSGQPARTEKFEGPPGSLPALVRQLGMQSGVGAPITVEGRLWGVVIAASMQAPQLPAGSELRIAMFTELLGTALANAQARVELRRIAAEQAALRRVATLVAHSVTPAEVLLAVATEVQALLDADGAMIFRFERDATATLFATAGADTPPGTRWTLEPPLAIEAVYRTGRCARVDDYGHSSGQVIEKIIRPERVCCSVASPIVVSGRLWGAIVIASRDAPLPTDTEQRMVDFTELVATAIANTQAREELRMIAGEQAALRRVATLVARGEPPAAVFAAVAEEVGQVLAAADFTMVARYDPDSAVEVVGSWSRAGNHQLVGRRAGLGGRNVSTLVFERKEPGRIDNLAYDASAVATAAGELGMRSSVGAPISVEGRLWGVMIVASTHEDALPAGTEHRLAEFIELVATAIANAQAREELRTLADEQAALRRVATLVARGEPPAAVFAAVAEEVGQVLIAADYTLVGRYHPNRTLELVGAWSRTGDDPIPVGRRISLEGETITALIFDTGRPARKDSCADAPGILAMDANVKNVGSAVGAPINVEGRVWGVVVVASTREEPLAPSTEEHLADFTRLVATAIANAEAHAQLTASRARIVATADQTRRRIERDLHDGAQQRLVSLALRLRAARAAVPPVLDQLAGELDRVAAGLTSTLDELREITRGIHPAILVEGGLAAALRTLARRSPVPVRLDVRTEARLPERVEVTAYYVVSEGLTNVAKHASASTIHISVDLVEGVHQLLRLSVSDDGIGGADPTHGSGLIGLKDRVEAIGGTVRLHSRPGEGTRLDLELPLEDS